MKISNAFRTVSLNVVIIFILSLRRVITGCQLYVHDAVSIIFIWDLYNSLQSERKLYRGLLIL